MVFKMITFSEMFTTMSFSEGQSESIVEDIENMVRSFIDKVKGSCSIFNLSSLFWLNVNFDDVPIILF